MAPYAHLFILGILFLGVFFGKWWILSPNHSKISVPKEKTEVLPEKECSIRTEIRTVRGTSLSGVFEPGQTVKILFGIYSCQKIERGDTVAYHYSGNENWLIKMVKGIPGDAFRLVAGEKNDWQVLINDRVLVNSRGEPYIFDENRHKILELYEKDFGGKIPENAYFILGNGVHGTLDSSVFGWVNKRDILGKAVLYTD